MTTVQKIRYMLAAASAVAGLGLFLDGHILAGILAFITAVLCLPILYVCLQMHSNAVQCISPALLAALTMFVFVLIESIPPMYAAPLQSVYTAPAAQTSMSSTTVAVTSVLSSAVPVTTATVANTQATEAVIATVTTTRTTQPPVTTQALSTAETVYRTPTGERYHCDASCGGENAYAVSLDEAIEQGLTPCKKCATDA